MKKLGYIIIACISAYYGELGFAGCMIIMAQLTEE